MMVSSFGAKLTSACVTRTVNGTGHCAARLSTRRARLAQGQQPHVVEDPGPVRVLPGTLSLPVASLVCGVVPFGASFVELYFVLDSLWMEAYYYLFGFAACGFILLVLAAAEVASLLTYYTLCAENHRWWWRAFLAPATTGLYVFGYAAYYYGAHLQDEAFDVLQAGLFFGYMALVALGVALVAGAAGFLASLKFLAYIFAQIKFD